MDGQQALSVTTKRRAVEKDLFAFVWVADPSSPDGSRVAFVRVTADQKKTSTTRPSGSHPPQGGPRATGGQRTRRAVASAVDTSCSLVRPGTGPAPQLYLISMGGGEPRAVTNLPKGAANPVVADGKTSPSRPRPGPTSSRPNQSRNPKTRRRATSSHHQAAYAMVSQAQASSTRSAGPDLDRRSAGSGTARGPEARDVG